MRSAMRSATPDLDMDLLDVNVWLALADENHVHHVRARRYWETESAAQIAFTRITMLGFVRLLTNRVVMNDRPFTVSAAWDAYRAFRALPEIVWVAEIDEDARAADDLLDTWLNTVTVNSMHSHWADAHLASIAAFTGCRLVSFDGGYTRFAQLAFLHLK